jgi:hypothetical protein
MLELLERISSLEYGTEYRKLAYDLSHKFYKEIIKSEKYSFAKNMVHDLNASIRCSTIECENHVRDCVAVIRLFAETGTVPRFATYYGGTSVKIKSIGFHREYFFSESKQEFVFTVSPEIKETVIAELESMISSYEETAVKETKSGNVSRAKCYTNDASYFKRVLRDVMYEEGK